MGETARRKRKRTQLLMMLEILRKSSQLTAKLDDIQYFYYYHDLVFLIVYNYRLSNYSPDSMNYIYNWRNYYWETVEVTI